MPDPDDAATARAIPDDAANLRLGDVVAGFMEAAPPAAAGVAEADEATAGGGLTAKLSKPSMLPRADRRTYAKVVGWLIGACIVALALVGLIKPDASGWAFAGLSAIGFALVVALLVLVMGYGKVEMSATNGPSGA